MFQFEIYSCTYDNRGVNEIAAELSKVDRGHDYEWTISWRDLPWVTADDIMYVRLAKVVMMFVAYFRIKKTDRIAIKTCNELNANE